MVQRNLSEDDDLKLIKRLIFSPNNLQVQKIDRGNDKTPDLQILLNGKLAAFCEFKSPRDDWLDNLIDQAKACTIIGGWREDPVFKKVRKHANKSSKQFEAVNPDRLVPNILIFVNHDDSSNFGDLREAFNGYFHSSDGSKHITMPEIATSLEKAKRNIDLCIWIDGNEERAECYFFNHDAIPNHLKNLCKFLNKDPRKIIY